MALPAGRLRHRITLQRPVYTQDAQTGDMVPSWEEVTKLWSEIAPLSGREFLAAQAEQSKITGRITIRKIQDIAATMRVQHGFTFYNIEAILPDSDSGLEYITLLVSAGVIDKTIFVNVVDMEDEGTGAAVVNVVDGLYNVIDVA